MPFDNKKALEAWKKAKPLLLTDTGVSDFLRKLPDPKSKNYLVDLGKAKTTLGTFMADAKIKAHKKAVAGLKQIQDGIDGHIEEVKENRKHVLGDMQRSRDAAKDYLAEAIKNPTEKALAIRWSQVMMADRGSRIGARSSVAHAFDPPLKDLVEDWVDAAYALTESHESIVKLLEFHARKPLPDIKTKLQQRIKQFGDAVVGLDKVKQTVNSMQL